MPASDRTLDDFMTPTPASGEEPLFPADFRGAVRHPVVRPGIVGYREYQARIAEASLKGSTLVVLPTGLGKTVIAALAAAQALHEGRGKVLIVAPTRALVDQHATSMENLLLTGAVVTLTGSVSPAARAELWTGADVVIATPQTLWNDVENERIDLRDVSLLVVDEAHRAVGDYAYVNIGKAYAASLRGGRVLALTASPGGKRSRIAEVIESLNITQVEVRRESDPDVAPYLHGVTVEQRLVPLTPGMREAATYLDALLRERIDMLRKHHFCAHKPIEYVGKKDLVDAGNQIRARMGRGGGAYLFAAMLHQGVALQAAHCLELLETQGCSPLHDYLSRMTEKPSRSQKVLLNDPRMRRVLSIAESEREANHPKMQHLVDTLREALSAKPDLLAIVFAQFRDTVRTIHTRLLAEGLPAVRFVGQATRNEDDPGLDQQGQRDVLSAFRRGEHRILVATQVAEEGIDVPAVDLVLFYEPIPSEIRSIQRRGRTGRARVGKVLVLIAENTRDEAYLRASADREDKMTRLLGRMAKHGVKAAQPPPEKPAPARARTRRTRDPAPKEP
ncbi:MAG TPA: DEAD/DEAH box helicase [Candidatus Thermoplasmatota archaeon]|nr:DEAD/DEAH box helicase [Candidatus Thermoplasmatota archaeon]